MIDYQLSFIERVFHQDSWYSNKLSNNSMSIFENIFELCVVKKCWSQKKKSRKIS